MVKPDSKENRPKLVLLSSIATSVMLVILFLFGAISTNTLRGRIGLYSCRHGCRLHFCLCGYNDNFTISLASSYGLV